MNQISQTAAGAGISVLGGKGGHRTTCVDTFNGPSMLLHQHARPAHVGLALGGPEGRTLAEVQAEEEQRWLQKEAYGEDVDLHAYHQVGGGASSSAVSTTHGDSGRYQGR